MKSNKVSDTYKLLYHEIIEELFWQICNANINYCIKSKVEDKEIPIAISDKFEEYKDKAVRNMSGKGRLDRHKLASCICGALIEISPLVGFQGAVIKKSANELLALHVGLNVIKAYMIYDFLSKLSVSQEEKKKTHRYLQENFDLQFPGNICDTQKYDVNLVNALYWSHFKCYYKKDECFGYDIWAYSKIFYHLELFNQEYLKQSYAKYNEEKEHSIQSV